MPPAPAPVPADPQPRPQPHAAVDLRTALLRPHQILDLVLAAPERVAANIAERRSLGVLACLLLAGSIALALPFGFALDWWRGWRVALFYVGALAICFPSLHVFCVFLGRRITLVQHAVLALVITAVAGAFAFGFFPIVWFLDATMDGSEVITAHGLASVLLALGLGAGLAHFWRCMGLRGPLTPNRLAVVALLAWHALFLFISWRLARVLGLA